MAGSPLPVISCNGVVVAVYGRVAALTVPSVGRLAGWLSEINVETTAKLYVSTSGFVKAGARATGGVPQRLNAALSGVPQRFDPALHTIPSLLVALSR